MKAKKNEKVVTLRIVQELLEDVRALARIHNRSLNSEILTALQEYIARYKRKEQSGSSDT